MVGIIFGIWMFFLPNVEVIVFGLNAVLLSSILTFRSARHLPYKMSFGWLNGILNCPHYHQLHLSTNPAHFDKNVGLNLIIWDRIFGTVEVPKPSEDFTFGLAVNEAKDHRSVAQLYTVPLINLAMMAGCKLRNLRPSRQLSRSAAQDAAYFQLAPTTSMNAGEIVRLTANHSMCGSHQCPDMLNMNP